MKTTKIDKIIDIYISFDKENGNVFNKMTKSNILMGKSSPLYWFYQYLDIDSKTENVGFKLLILLKDKEYAI
jgi:hypothetical protein